MTWFESNSHKKSVALFSQMRMEHYRIGPLVILDADLYENPGPSQKVRVAGHGKKQFTFVPYGWCTVLRKHGYTLAQGAWTEEEKVEFGLIEVDGNEVVIIGGKEVGPKDQCIFFDAQGSSAQEEGTQEGSIRRIL